MASRINNAHFYPFFISLAAIILTIYRT
ncbi:hypothetical protein DDZ16_18915 [Marinilabilia rubra]|uniref:Uncharacterized protein n=1 Tax=Marinilabilia rubra TaxID=2162893 RepID=A0A2U2B422_9BACT|nr:hypothetical protein DDZ16_18915 [Marinilabilia rubra]